MSMSGLETPDLAEPVADAPESSTAGMVVIGNRRYLRAPVPVFFPESELVPESTLHLEQCVQLYQSLKLAFADRATIGCDQFVYWNPTDPRECLAPDAFVRLGRPNSHFRSWKVWERGAPEVAVEIISPSDDRDRDWDGKVAKYRRLGVRELVSFDPEADTPALRIWDGVEGDLVERQAVGRGTPSRCLPGAWVVIEDPEHGLLLRLSHDLEGLRLYPTPVEREAEARKQEAEARKQEAAARVAAEERIRELEAELRRR